LQICRDDMIDVQVQMLRIDSSNFSLVDLDIDLSFMDDECC